MAIIDPSLQKQLDEQKGVDFEVSMYQPSDDERETLGMVRTHFALGYSTMYKPRVEFNDLSTLSRDQTDFLAWNTYQPNNGDSYPGDQINGWRSNAIRPIERNKAISIAAHAAARVLYPKIFAFDEESNHQADAATVISDLMQWAGERYDYEKISLQAIIQALVAPASIVFTEYTETFREVKRGKDANGKYVKERMIDEAMSGFRQTIVPVDQLFIENIFEPEIQKQGWLIWRRVQDHRLMKEKYGHLPNFDFVKIGMQCLFNDANQGFYYIYDPELRKYMDEEVIYWNKSMDVMLVVVNGVLVTSYDNANPREDKMYPFAKFGYEYIKSNFFYYKSLVFKCSHDANIINTLYPMIIDGTYLNIMPPFFSQGDEIIGSDVIVPGKVTTLVSPNSQLQPIKLASDIKSGMDALFKVEESLNQTSEIAVTPDKPGATTAYEISKREQERNTALGLFLQMISDYVKQFGKLQLCDILQHLTIAQADQIEDDPELVYRTFLVNVKHNTGEGSGAKHSTRKIQFDYSMSNDVQSPEQQLKESFKTLQMQGGSKAETELYRVSPELIRKLQYMVICSPDTLTPRSEDVERAFGLELYDRAIQNPVADQQAVTRDFLFGLNPKSAKHPEKYIQQAPPGGTMPPSPGGQPQMGQPQQQSKPMGQPALAAGVPQLQ